MPMQADILNVRIHELRHTFAFLRVSGGVSLEMIGRRLAHAQIGTPQRYAHLIGSPLQTGGNAAGGEAEAAMAGRG
jgi:site-specific recombinase XerD